MRVANYFSINWLINTLAPFLIQLQMIGAKKTWYLSDVKWNWIQALIVYLTFIGTTLLHTQLKKQIYIKTCEIHLPCVAKLHLALSFSICNAVMKKNNPPNTKTPVGIYNAYWRLKNSDTLDPSAFWIASET